MEVQLRALSGKSHLPIILEVGNTILGREGILGIEDKRCSRQQASILVSDSKVTLTRVCIPFKSILQLIITLTNSFYY